MCVDVLVFVTIVLCHSPKRSVVSVGGRPGKLPDPGQLELGKERGWDCMEREILLQEQSI